MTAFCETETVELKKSTSELKEAIVSLVAMLNKHQRGELWFGIKKDGTVVGQQVAEKTVRDVSKSISEHIEPKVYPVVEQTTVNGRQCIRVQVEGAEHPYYAYGRAYIRVGDEDRQLSAKELERLILDKNRDWLRWDTEVCAKAKTDDIGSGKLKSFLKLSGLKFDTVQNSLEKLNLLQDAKLLNAAVICFARKPEKFFPNARLRCALCGIRIVTPEGHTVVEAAHIVPWCESRNDDLRNGMALCRLCHWGFDEGMLGVSTNYQVITSASIGLTPNFAGQLQTLTGRGIIPPQDSALWPAQEYLGEHRHRWKL